MENKRDFDRLYIENFHLMVMFARKFVNDSDTCQDIVNDVFENVWRNFASLDSSQIKSYLFSAVRNGCLDHLRHSDCHSRYIKFVEQLSARYIDTERYLEEKERIELAHAVVDSIGPPTSTIIYACYVDGKKYSEVAESLGMSIANVKKHMVKALRMIREKRLKK